ncbi:MAG: dephospho-CoA kinase [Phycisphaerae bacterium]|nr:dephospho-CoA kinase [Phycisphaerae bacterium]
MKQNKPCKNSSAKAAPAQSTMPVIGLAGGIGSGKTLVANQLGQMGAAVIDVDRLAKQLRDLPQTRQALRQSLGEAIFTEDGQIDEKALSELVFAPTQQQKDSPLARLNAIVHPLVVAKCRRLIDQYRRQEGPKALILDAPLLFEAGLETCCDAVIFVTSQPRSRSQRVQAHRGWTENNWARREKTQIPLDKKLEMSDYSVDNNSSKTDLRCHLQRLLSRILGKTSSIQRSSVEPCGLPGKHKHRKLRSAENNGVKVRRTPKMHETQEKDGGL